MERGRSGVAERGMPSIGEGLPQSNFPNSLGIRNGFDGTCHPRAARRFNLFCSHTKNFLQYNPPKFEIVLSKSSILNLIFSFIRTSKSKGLKILPFAIPPATRRLYRGFGKVATVKKVQVPHLG